MPYKCRLCCMCSSPALCTPPASVLLAANAQQKRCTKMRCCSARHSVLARICLWRSPSGPWAEVHLYSPSAQAPVETHALVKHQNGVLCGAADCSHPHHGAREHLPPAHRGHFRD